MHSGSISVNVASSASSGQISAAVCANDDLFAKMHAAEIKAPFNGSDIVITCVKCLDQGLAWCPDNNLCSGLGVQCGEFISEEHGCRSDGDESIQACQQQCDADPTCACSLLSHPGGIQGACQLRRPHKPISMFDVGTAEGSYFEIDLSTIGIVSSTVRINFGRTAATAMRLSSVNLFSISPQQDLIAEWYVLFTSCLGLIRFR
jgi:hypothetical protein